MKNLKNAITDNLINYYANSINLFDFVENNISPFIEISEESKETIRLIISQSQRGWYAIECDEEGPTKEQDEEMDAYIESVTAEILNSL